MEKTVKIGRTVYHVKADENEINAYAVTYPNPPYSNCFEDGYTIELTYSKGWAKATVNGADHGWARRGSMQNAWIDATGYIRRGEAEKFKAEIVRALEQAEDGTPDVKVIFDNIKAKVETVTGEEEE